MLFKCLDKIYSPFLKCFIYFYCKIYPTTQLIGCIRNRYVLYISKLIKICVMQCRYRKKAIQLLCVLLKVSINLERIIPTLCQLHMLTIPKKSKKKQAHAHTLYNISLRLVFILDFLHAAISLIYKQWYYGIPESGIF